MSVDLCHMIHIDLALLHNGNILLFMPGSINLLHYLDDILQLLCR
ncbi:unnamed protein product [Camellia sinensis]